MSCSIRRDKGWKRDEGIKTTRRGDGEGSIKREDISPWPGAFYVLGWSAMKRTVRKTRR